MIRDMDLVRQILRIMEDRAWSDRGPIHAEGRSEEEIAYHVKLLHEAGLIEAIDASTRSGLRWVAISLTWDGHEFLDAARDDDRWNRTKTLVKEKAGSVGFEVIRQVLVALAKQAVGL
jgi:hypothetical protein